MPDAGEGEISMKQIARLLVPLAGSATDQAALTTAAAVARPFGAHVAAVFFRIDPLMLPMMASDSIAAGQVITLIEEQERAAAAQGKALFEGWRAREGIGADASGEAASASWSEAVGDERRQVARLARLSDLCVFSLGEGTIGRTETMLEGALFASGRPVLLAPRTPRDTPFGSAVVAWDGSLEAARALSGALPFLARCADIRVFTQAEARKDQARAADAVAFLREHGLTASAGAPAAKSDDIADAILECCAAAAADLLVMGAYTHSRLRETVFGGVTRRILETAQAPAVLLAH